MIMAKNQPLRKACCPKCGLPNGFMVDCEIKTVCRSCKAVSYGIVYCGGCGGAGKIIKLKDGEVVPTVLCKKCSYGG